MKTPICDKIYDEIYPHTEDGNWRQLAYEFEESLTDTKDKLETIISSLESMMRSYSDDYNVRSTIQKMLDEIQ